MTTRIGPRMREIVDRLAMLGGAERISSLSRAVGPHNSLAYGYRAVQRAESHGLVDITHPRPGATLVTLTDVGRRVAS